jgi:hypothetical protein
MMRHREGPFRVDEWTPKPSMWQHPKHVVIVDDCGGIVAAVGPGGDPQALADGALLAAAPEMLAACEMSLERLEVAWALGDGPWLQTLRAAVAKARGEEYQCPFEGEALSTDPARDEANHREGVRRGRADVMNEEE